MVVNQKNKSSIVVSAVGKHVKLCRKVLDKQEKEEQLIKRSALVRLASEHKKQVEIQRRRKIEAKRIGSRKLKWTGICRPFEVSSALYW